MPIFIDEAKAAQEPKFILETKFVPEAKFVTEAKFVAEPRSVDDVPALVQLLRNRSYAEIRQRMYDSAPGSPWWSACRAELELRNGQQVAEASLKSRR